MTPIIDSHDAGVSSGLRIYLGHHHDDSVDSALVPSLPYPYYPTQKMVGVAVFQGPLVGTSAFEVRGVGTDANFTHIDDAHRASGQT